MSSVSENFRLSRTLSRIPARESKCLNFNFDQAEHIFDQRLRSIDKDSKN